MRAESHRIVKIDEMACAKTCALLALGATIILTILAWILVPVWMGGYGAMSYMMGGMMRMMGSASFGWSFLGLGAIIIWLYALVWGFVAGWVFAWLYNLIVPVTGGWKHWAEHGKDKK